MFQVCGSCRTSADLRKGVEYLGYALLCPAPLHLIPTINDKTEVRPLLLVTVSTT